MAILKLLEATNIDGLTLTLDDTGSLVWTGSRATAEKWLPVLRDRKAEIIAYLGNTAAQPKHLDIEALYETFTERAAIMEYDGGLGHLDAEREAFIAVIKGSL